MGPAVGLCLLCLARPAGATPECAGETTCDSYACEGTVVGDQVSGECLVTVRDAGGNVYPVTVPAAGTASWTEDGCEEVLASLPTPERTCRFDRLEFSDFPDDNTVQLALFVTIADLWNIPASPLRDEWPATVWVDETILWPSDFQCQGWTGCRSYCDCSFEWHPTALDLSDGTIDGDVDVDVVCGDWTPNYSYDDCPDLAEVSLPGECPVNWQDQIPEHSQELVCQLLHAAGTVSGAAATWHDTTHRVCVSGTGACVDVTGAIALQGAAVWRAADACELARELACLPPEDPPPGGEVGIGDIIITEFMPNPSGSDDNKEYLEIYNRTDQPVNLEGWILGSDPPRFNRALPAIVAPPNGYLVLASNSSPSFNCLGGVPVAYAFGNVFNLRNTTDVLYLALPPAMGGAVVDSVNYAAGAWPFWSGRAAELKLQAYDAVANDAPHNWMPGSRTFGCGDHGSPGAPPPDGDGDGWSAENGDCDDTRPDVYPEAPEVRDGVDQDCDKLVDEGVVEPGELLITELSPDPNGDDRYKEYLEVYNASDIPISLSGWRLRNNGTYSVRLPVTTSGPWVEPGQYAILSASGDPSANCGLPSVFAFGRGYILLNGTNQIVMEFEGVEIDRVNYDSGWPWRTGIAAELTLAGYDVTANDSPANWAAARTVYCARDRDRGTPGAPPYHTLGESYVDGRYGDDLWDGSQRTHNGWYGGPKRTIAAGLDVTATGGVCHVAPAVYPGRVLMKPGVHLSGAGMGLSVIDGLGLHEGREDRVVTMAEGSRLSGFSIINGGFYGVEFRHVSATLDGNWIADHALIGVHVVGNNTDAALIRNNVVTGCRGTLGAIVTNAVWGSPQIVNNTVVGNRSAGIVLLWWGSPVVQNNIVENNQGGIWAQAEASPLLGYNDVWGNEAFDYYGCEGGDGAFSDDPLFWGEGFRLAPGSPCIDAGNPDPAFADPDGSRNDIGAFGGPGSPVWRCGYTEIDEAVRQRLEDELRRCLPSYLDMLDQAIADFAAAACSPPSDADVLGDWPLCNGQTLTDLFEEAAAQHPSCVDTQFARYRAPQTWGQLQGDREIVSMTLTILDPEGGVPEGALCELAEGSQSEWEASVLFPGTVRGDGCVLGALAERPYGGGDWTARVLEGCD